MTDLVPPPGELFLKESSIRGGMDLMFFANSRHLRHADEKLAERGFGRAHHRVLYFVARRPDMAVTDLLEVLGVTKQSFGRVSNNLLAAGLLERRTDDRDRRRRLLRLTPAGAALERSLFDELHDNISRAFAASGATAVAGFWTVMQHVMGPQARDQFRRVYAGIADGGIPPKP